MKTNIAASTLTLAHQHYQENKGQKAQQENNC